jgi:hypothetical protein
VRILEKVILSAAKDLRGLQGDVMPWHDLSYIPVFP